MTSSFRLARVRGIEIGANWSWLLVVVLIFWSLAVGVFPDENPGLSDGTYAAMAVVAAIVFFASLLAHELGHAIQAQRDGVEIDGITLWVLGGVARFTSEPPTAGAEFRIAAAGPAVSLVLGLAFLGLSSIGGLPSSVDGVLSWLGYINLVLLAFNLLPAFPLDGGRILRSILWWRGDDLGDATRRAAAAGRAFGAGIAALGALLVLGGGVFGGIWLAFIGFFIMAAGTAEEQAVASRSALAGIRVGDVMVERPVVVPASMPAERFLEEVFNVHRHTAYPVSSDGDEIEGLVTFRDVLGADPQARASLTVGDVMVSRGEALVLDADAELADVLSELGSDPRRRALVRHDGQIDGLLSVTDALRVLDARGVGGGRR